MVILTHFLAVILLFLLGTVRPIWPPSYKINLTHEETFEISEVLGIGDDDSEDDEMIKSSDLKKLGIKDNNDKYDRLHEFVARFNTKESETNFYNKKRLKKRTEPDYESKEVIPWEAGFVDKNNKINPDTKRSFYIKENVLVVNKSRREIKVGVEETDANYDYDSLKSEYEKNLKNVKKDKQVLNYTDVKEEESFKDAVDVILGKNQTRNCTIEERQGIGIAAAKCMFSDLTKGDTSEKERSAIFHRIGTIILIWILVYLLVAIPCWCQRGWCCCCFQCKFCKPRERIDEAKKFLLNNPTGVYHTADNKKIKYESTNYEKYAQKNLEKALSKL